MKICGCCPSKHPRCDRYFYLLAQKKDCHSPGCFEDETAGKSGGFYKSGGFCNLLYSVFLLDVVYMEQV